MLTSLIHFPFAFLFFSPIPLTQSHPTHPPLCSTFDIIRHLS
jgi:hypothetical protein